MAMWVPESAIGWFDFDQPLVRQATALAVRASQSANVTINHLPTRPPRTRPETLYLYASV